MVTAREETWLFAISDPCIRQKLVSWSLSFQMQGPEMCDLPLARVGGEWDTGVAADVHQERMWKASVTCTFRR